jgi:ribonuclease D
MAVDARCQGITKQGLPCRAWATRSGFCPIHAPELVGIVAEARRRGGYNRANAKRLRRLLEESALWPVFEAAMDAFARLEQGELSPQVAVAASHLLKIALETVETAHKLSREEGAPPQVLPSITVETQEERWARIVARATQICEEAKETEPPGASLGLSEREEKEARLIAEAARELERVWRPSQLRQPPSALPAEAPHVPTVGARLVVHGREP